MLPGLRFLFAAIVLSTSILIFGLGAAALLRAAHEEVANIPARRSPPEPVFAQAQEKLPTETLPTEAPPALAILRVDPPASETPERAPESAETSSILSADTSAPAEQEQIAAVKPDEPASTEAPVAAPPVADAPAPQAPPAAAQTDAPAPATEAPAPAEEAKPAAVAEAPPASEVPPSAPETPPAPAEKSPAATSIATLGGPAVTVEETKSAKRADPKPDQSAAKKRARAERARERRRLAQQQHPVRQVIPQQQFDPFGQPIMMRPTR
jgi:hypothetical protein